MTSAAPSAGSTEPGAADVAITSPEPFTPPWSPYPGLRPFQPDESEYFYGRDVEVDQVMARLRDRRFVAVIGGSGSGKSSLVLAGAIARLRSFAIKDAGDFWAPVVATPGTNHVEGDSPVRRLARKFCGELIDMPDASARFESCVAILRRKNGLGELVERFGGQLKNAEGVSLDRMQVNFLFLLDQFEELFHPSNAREPIAGDCRDLVDRIVEQFKQPHPQVCVALTMRSEHLNDCPRYEELPDAINAASYLVKRLGPEQLRQAIEQPVLRYLRKQVAEQRSERRQARIAGKAMPPAQPVPDSIPIDPELITRLLDDSKAVLAGQDHADQLPLLQHLLFWVWHEASARCAGKPLVDSLTPGDLRRAVCPMPGAEAQPLGASVNTLEACLENRCELIFSRYPAEQEAWEAVFRSLAFKEPNTGTYTQQRASMVELRKRLQLDPGGDDNDALALHLQPWMAPHGYLHWDTGSRTVKVAHETLIRRWQRFRHWIDEEDRQFHVYLRLLEDCERWVRAGRGDEALSGGETLRRYEDEQLPQTLKDPARVASINRLLGIDRDGQRLTVASSDAALFLDRSIENRRERERERHADEDQKRQAVEQLAQAHRDTDVQRAKNAELVALAQAEQARITALESSTAAAKERSRRVRLRQLLLFMAVVLLMPLTAWVTAAYFAERTLATKERTLHRSYALAAESQVAFEPQFKDLDGPQGVLRYALIGAYFFDQGRNLPTGPAAWPLLNSYYAERLDALRNTERFSEARNTASLRTILHGAVWTAPRTTASTPAAPAAARTGDQHCRMTAQGLLDNGPSVPDAYFFERPGATHRRGLILVVGSAQASMPSSVTTDTTVTTVSVGHIDSSGNCVIEQQLLSTPPQTPPLRAARVGIASDASNIVIAFSGYTQFYTVIWDPPAGVSTRPRAVASTELGNDFQDGSLASNSQRFWTDVSLGRTTVRLFDLEPSLISVAEAQGGLAFKAVQTLDAAAVCREFARTHEIDLAQEALWELRVPGHHDTDHRDFCFRVTTSKDGGGGTFYFGSLYGLTESAAAGQKGRNLPLINQLPLGTGAPVGFRLDLRQGWMAFSDGRVWHAVPWSLDALRAMADEVFRATAVASAPAASAGNPAPRQGCGRPGDDPQFDLPFNLILGDTPCPNDTLLTPMTGTATSTAAPRTASAATASQLSPAAPAESPGRTPPASSPPRR